MPAGEPVDAYRGARRRDAAVVRLRFAEWEERVGLPLDQQCRCRDPIQRRRGTGTAEEIDGLRCGYTVSRHVQVRRADIRREAAAGRVAVGEELTDSFDELRVFGEIGKVGALCRIGGRLGAVGCALGELAKDAVAAYAAAEEQPRPLLLEDAVGWVFTRRLREEGAREVIPSDHGNDRVDPAVLTGEHQGQRTAVRTAHD